ncbi:MAG TPA: hypothetical protein EYO73_12495 [Sulfurimonas sp.]|nr:hypothetical protein [Sulfurimonas sp.]
MWLTKLKIAIAEKNTDSISVLMDSIPKFESIERMKEAQFLLKEATSLASILQSESLSSMRQIKKNINFIQSTQEVNTRRLDISL